MMEENERNRSKRLGKRMKALAASLREGFFESMNLPAPVFVAKKIEKDADAFKQHLPLIHALCNPGLRPRHWEEISEALFSMLK